MPRWVRRMLVVLAALMCVGLGASCWALTTPAQSTAAALGQAEGRWAANHASHYMLSVRILSMHDGRSFRLEVRDERIVAGWKGNGSTPLDATTLQELSAFLPVDRLFEVATKQVSAPTEWREWLARALPPIGQWLAPSCSLRPQPPLHFDSERGYPRSVFIGVSSCAFDHDGLEVRIDDFQPLP